MKDKYLNKYRTGTNRATWWNYADNGVYFITICTHNRELFFGRINHGIMNLSETGKLAEQYWLEIPNHFPDVALDAFVVMPNHVHGILVINKRNGKNGNNLEQDTGVETPKLGVSTRSSAPVPSTGKRTEMASKRWIPQTMGVIINQYKRICTIHARKINVGFGWQARYYDHIIRNDAEFQRIRDYINNNPGKWETDSLKSN